MIKLVEWESHALTRTQFEQLQQQPSFTRLLQSGVVSLGTSRHGGFKLTASHYVGSARLENGIEIDIAEKAPGTIAGLFEQLSNARFKLPKVATNATSNGIIFLHIARQFLDLTEQYLGRGRVREYQRASHVTSSPKGRLDIRGTMRIKSRAQAGRVSVCPWVLTPDVYINQVLAYCLAELENLVLHRGEMSSLLNRSRRLFLAFQDVEFRNLRWQRPESRAEGLQRLLAQVNVAERQMLECAYPLYVGGGLFGDEKGLHQTPSLFLDLEYLFERACVDAFSRRKDGPKIEKLSKTTLFKEGGETVHPDITLATEGQIVAIGDVKYKNMQFGTGLVAADLYQLLAHAEAVNVKKAFLVYPGTSQVTRRLGTSMRGTEVFATTVRPRQLDDDLQSLLNAMFPLAASS